MQTERNSLTFTIKKEKVYRGSYTEGAAIGITKMQHKGTALN